MIIVPTEKRLDWRYAPVVICALVLINVLVFFLYQSGDAQKFDQAITTYQSSDYFSYEWPLFQIYLEEQEETQLLDNYRQQYADDYYNQILGDMLMRADFFEYLKDQAYSAFPAGKYEQWAFDRSEIHRLLESTSAIKYGLIASNLQVTDFLTHQFLHGDLMHLLGNMFFLIVCGFAVEAAIGHWRFLAFYLLSGTVAGLVQAAIDWNSSQPLIGASGAISGVMAMYLAVFRLKKIEFFYWFLFFVGYIRAPALLILPFYIGKEIYSYYHDAGSNIAFMAHAGGFVAGAILIFLAWLVNRSIFNEQYIEQDQRIDPDREKLAEVYSFIESFHFDRALATINHLIQEHGADFEYCLIRYNLLKLIREEELPQAALELLATNFSDTNIPRLGKIWQENTEIHTQLSDAAVLKIGLQLTALEDPTSAEEIFLRLQNDSSESLRLSVYAAKLASAFERIKRLDKRNYYQGLSNKLAQGGNNGFV